MNVFYIQKFPVIWPSIKPGTWNMPEHSGTSRNMPEHRIIIIIIRKACEIGKKEKKPTNYYYTGDSNLVTHPSTNPVEQGLTSLSGRNMSLVV